MAVGIRAARPDEWRQAKELRLGSLRETPLAYLETLAAAGAYSDERCRGRVARSPTREQVIAVADDGSWVGQAVARRGPGDSGPGDTGACSSR